MDYSRRRGNKANSKTPGILAAAVLQTIPMKQHKRPRTLEEEGETVDAAVMSIMTGAFRLYLIIVVLAILLGER